MYCLLKPRTPLTTLSSCLKVQFICSVGIIYGTCHEEQFLIWGKTTWEVTKAHNNINI